MSKGFTRLSPIFAILSQWRFGGWFLTYLVNFCTALISLFHNFLFKIFKQQISNFFLMWKLNFIFELHLRANKMSLKLRFLPLQLFSEATVNFCHIQVFHYSLKYSVLCRYVKFVMTMYVTYKNIYEISYNFFLHTSLRVMEIKKKEKLFSQIQLLCYYYFVSH